MITFRSIAMTVACSVAGLLSVAETCKADPYYWGVGFGYSSYYAPYYSGYSPYYSGYSPYWSGYSPYWSSSFYWPSYSYASYAPAYAYGYGNACCAPSCCDPCATGTCGPGGCGVPDRPAGDKKPVPDSPPKTYEDDNFKPRNPADNPPPAPNGTGTGSESGTNPDETTTFKPTEVQKPVADEKVVIPQKAPMTDPAEAAPSSGNTILGPKATTPPTAEPEKAPAPAGNAPPAEKKEDTKVDAEDLKLPAPAAQENPHPTVLRLDARRTWQSAPARTRLALRPTVGSVKNVRHSPLPANRHWTPVEEPTTIVRK